MARTQPGVDLLGGVELFADLSKAELRRVASLAKVVEFRAGESVTEEGTPGGRFYVIESGTAKVMIRGRTRGSMGPGDAFGEISLVDGGPRAATVVAVEPLCTYAIAEWNFRSLLKSNASIAYKIALVLCRRLREREAIDATC